MNLPAMMICPVPSKAMAETPQSSVPLVRVFTHRTCPAESSLATNGVEASVPGLPAGSVLEPRVIAPAP